MAARLSNAQVYYGRHPEERRPGRREERSPERHPEERSDEGSLSRQGW